MTVSVYRSLLVAGLLPAMAAASAVAAPGAAPAPTIPAPASTDPLETLVKDSPFLPQSGGGAAAGQNGPLELRSIVMEKGAYVFSLYDLASKQSYWTGLNETGFPFVARSYDRTSDTLTIEQQGRTMMLTLAAARTMPANTVVPGQPSPGTPVPPGFPGAQPQPPGAVANGQAQPVTGISPNGITPDEAQRLQRIADEIRRRRNVGRAPVAPTNTPTKP